MKISIRTQTVSIYVFYAKLVPLLFKLHQCLNENQKQHLNQSQEAIK